MQKVPIIFLKLLTCTGGIWAGWDDEMEEGTFSNANTEEPLTKDLDLWYAGEPNGGRMENCAMVWVPRKAWNDLSCSAYCHGFCHLEARPRIKMRGAIFQQVIYVPSLIIIISLH